MTTVIELNASSAYDLTLLEDQGTRMLPIGHLFLSELNVRTVRTTEEQDAELKASIKAQAIIQNLVCLPETQDGYGVVAGGRRFQQLLALVDDGDLSLDDVVPVKVLTEQQAEHYAEQMSLTENITRAAMHPADEFTAFASMIEKGASVETVAQHFGKTQLYVHQRMKLAGVHTEVLEAYKEGELSLEKVMVFTIAPPEHQAKVWESVKKNPRMYSDNQLRTVLKEEALEDSHYLVKFVGQDAYEQAGGQVTSDLFSEKVYFEDRALVETLANAKLDEEGDKLKAQGWKWTQNILQRTFNETKGYLELTPNKGQYKKAEKALAGCILTIGWSGEVSVTKGLVAKSERKALKAVQAAAKSSEKGNAKGEGGSSESAASSVEVESTYFNALTDDLQAHRLAMAKHALMQQSQLAIDLLYFTICLKEFEMYTSTPVDAALHSTYTEPKQGDFGENLAHERILALRETLDSSWLEADSYQERFDAFVKLDAEEKQKQVAFAVASSLKPSMATDNHRFNYEFVYQMLEFDAADYWRPTTDSFLKRINKTALLDIAKPVMSPEWLAMGEAMKKGDIVAQLDTWLSGGDDSLTKKQKDHFAKWMPEGF